jgi:hypothetical protein
MSVTRVFRQSRLRHFPDWPELHFARVNRHNTLRDSRFRTLAVGVRFAGG